MLQESNLEKSVAELYSLLGHHVQGVVKRGDFTTDLVIKAKNGEKWIARCEHRKEVGDATMRDFFSVLQTEKAKQSAIVTTGTFAPEARRLAEGKPIHLLDGTTFQNYLSRARALSQKPAEAPSQSPLTEIERSQSSPENQAQGTTLKKCPYCAEMIPEEAQTCPLCELDLTKPHTPNVSPLPSASTPQRRKTNPFVILLLIAVIALGVSQLGFYTVQPIGGIPDGVTLVVWRASGEPFFNSPDALCLKIQGGVSLLCRGLAMTQAPVDRIILRLPYMEWTYLMSTGGRAFDR